MPRTKTADLSAATTGHLSRDHNDIGLEEGTFDPGSRGSERLMSK